MKKQNKQTRVFSYLSSVTIFSLILISQYRLVYAQVPSQSLTPVSNSNKNQQQSLTLNEELTLRNSTIAIIVSVITAITGVVAVIISFKQMKKQTLDLDKLLNKIKPFILELFNQLINQTKDETEKQRLLEQKNLFEELFNKQDKLIKRSEVSKKARKWLIDNKKALAEKAVTHSLSDNTSIRQEERDEFCKDIIRYLYGIHEALNPDIGGYEPIDVLEITNVLPRDSYVKALEFIINKEVPKILSEAETAEIKFYFDYIIRKL